MSPLLFFAFLAGLNGYCVHKKWWGGVAFCSSMLIWLMLMQTLQAYMLHAFQN